MDFERFNQGFGKFGPMEQCNDGEWVRFEHAALVLKGERRSFERRLQESNNTIRRLDIERDEAESKVNALEEAICNASKDLSDFRSGVEVQKKRCDALKKELEQRDDEIARLKQVVESFERGREVLRAALESKTNEIMTLEKHCLEVRNDRDLWVGKWGDSMERLESGGKKFEKMRLNAKLALFANLLWLAGFLTFAGFLTLGVAHG